MRPGHPQALRTPQVCQAAARDPVPPVRSCIPTPQTG
jgi:hypothetical protein